MISKRETLLDMMHPIFNQLCSDHELALYNHLPIVASLLLQYCHRFIPTSTEENSEYMKVIKAVETSLQVALQPYQHIVLVNMITHLMSGQIEKATEDEASNLRQ